MQHTDHSHSDTPVGPFTNHEVVDTSDSAPDSPLELFEADAEVAAKKAVLSEKEEQAVTQALTRLLTSVKEIEVKNHTVIYEKKGTGHARTVMISIPPPDPDQLGELTNQFTSEADQFPLDSPAYNKMRKEGLRLIEEYAYYKKPVKILRFGETSDGNIRDLFEWYLDNEKMVMPNKEGMLPVPLPPQAIMRYDARFGSPDSWAADRYSHLIELE